MVKNASGKQGYRSFTVVGVGKHANCKTKFHGGKYVSKDASGAARKAFSELCRVKKIRGVCTLVVSIKETTQGSKKKVYTYKLKRHKLKQPVIRFEGTDSEYVNLYGVRATSLKDKKITPSKKCKSKKQTRGRMSKKTKGRRNSPNNIRRRIARMLRM